MKTKKELNVVRFSMLMEKLVSDKRIDVKEGNDANQQYLQLLNVASVIEEENFLSFKKYEDMVDMFYVQFLSLDNFAALWKVLKLIFSMFHGQSAVERGFTTNDGFVVENQSEVSLIALRMVYDHLRAEGVASHNIEISTNLRKSVLKARDEIKST